MLPTLIPCPHCGVKLAPNLVAAIIDPRADESCPRQSKSRPVANIDPHAASKRLLGLAFLGSAVA